MADHVAGAGKMVPLRIQRRRSAGSRLPPNTVCVSRPHWLGNPFRVGVPHPETGQPMTAADAVELFRQATRTPNIKLWTASGGKPIDLCRILLGTAASLYRGRNQACWCKLCDLHRDGLPLGTTCPDCAPCHVDVTLPLANGKDGLAELVRKAMDGLVKMFTGPGITPAMIEAAREGRRPPPEEGGAS